MNMQLLKTSGTFFLSSIKKLRKTLLGEGGGGGGRHPPLLYVRGLVLNGFLPRLRKKADEIHKALFFVETSIHSQFSSYYLGTIICSRTKGKKHPLNWKALYTY